jgi:hypothetical protein
MGSPFSIASWVITATALKQMNACERRVGELGSNSPSTLLYDHACASSREAVKTNPLNSTLFRTYLY